MNRRTLLKVLTCGLGAVFGLLMGFPAIAYLFDPRKRRMGAGRFKRVAKLGDLPAPVEGQAGAPVQVAVRDIRRDAWSVYPDEVVGRVWLIRQPDDQVTAFTSICPHLGCSINYYQATGRFVCPCHNGTFDLTGQRVEEADLGTTNPAPRGMDELETRLVPMEDDEVAIEVRYQNFVHGVRESIPKV